MVLDQFGLWMAYGPSKRNPQNWYFSGLDNDPRIFDKVNISPIEGGFVGKGTARLSISTSAKYKQTLTTLDHDKCQAQGFMMSRWDWRDVEITGEIRYVRAGKNAKVSFFTRSGDITRACEGTGYGIEITPDGMIECSMRHFYPGGTTVLDHSHGHMGDIEGRWIKFKVCVFNDPTGKHVMLRGFVDEHGNGSFIPVCAVTDIGLGVHGNRCGSDAGQVITWGGPLSMFNMEGEDDEDGLPTEVEVRNFSIREIDPFNKYGRGGGLTGAGFKIDREIEITPDPVVIDNEPDPLPPIDVEEIDDVTNPDIINHLFNQKRSHVDISRTLAPTTHSVMRRFNTVGGSYVAGNANMLLYKKTGRTSTMVEGPFKTRHYASGKPDDITKEWNGSVDSTWKNYTVCFYVTITRIDHDDAISTKVYGPNHSDGNCCWYIFDIGFQRGNCWFAYEDPHPSTTKTNDAVGAPIGSIVNKKIGLQIVISQVGSGAKMEAWIDSGDGLWRKHSEKLNIGNKQYSPSSNHRPQIRIDAAPGIIMHDVVLAENTPGLEFVGTDGGGGAPPVSNIKPIPDWGDIGDDHVGGGVITNPDGTSGGTTPSTGTKPTVMSKPYTGGLGRITAKLTGQASGGGDISNGAVKPILATPPSNKMIDFGGIKYGGAKVHVIFMGTVWRTGSGLNWTMSQMTSKIKALFASKYFDHLIQYGVKRPASVDFCQVDGDFSENPTFNSYLFVVMAAVEKGCGSKNAPNWGEPYNPNEKHIDFIFTPPGQPDPNEVGFNGFHSNSPQPYEQPFINPDVVATATYRSNINHVLATFSGEILETLTDPIPHGNNYGIVRYDTVAGGGTDGKELCDQCEDPDYDIRYGTLPGTSLLVSKYWSNQHNACVVLNSKPTYISCPVGYAWDDVKQECVPTSADSGLTGSLVTGNVTGTIIGVGGTDETRATYAGKFIGRLGTKLIGTIEGTIEGSGQGIGNSSNENKTGLFSAEVTGTVTGNGTATIAGKIEGQFTGVSVPIGSGGSGPGTGQGGTGNTGGGTQTPTPDKQEPSPIHVEADLQVIYAIDNMEGDPCNINSPYETPGLDELFNAPPDDIYAQTRYYRRIGAYVNRPSSKLVGHKLRNVKVIMNKEGPGVLQGKIFVRVRNGNRTIVDEFQTVIEASELIEEDVTYEFTHESPQHTIERGDFVYVEYPAGGSFDTFVKVKLANTDKADGENTCLVTHDGVNEQINPDKDPGFIISG